MFTTILAILGALVLIAAFAAFILKVFPQLVSVWDWMLSLIDLFNEIFPAWVLPIFLCGVVVAAISIVVKLI